VRLKSVSRRAPEYFQPRHNACVYIWCYLLDLNASDFTRDALFFFRRVPNSGFGAGRLSILSHSTVILYVVRELEPRCFSEGHPRIPWSQALPSNYKSQPTLNRRGKNGATSGCRDFNGISPCTIEPPTCFRTACALPAFKATNSPRQSPNYCTVLGSVPCRVVSTVVQNMVPSKRLFQEWWKFGAPSSENSRSLSCRNFDVTLLERFTSSPFPARIFDSVPAFRIPSYSAYTSIVFGRLHDEHSIGIDNGRSFDDVVDPFPRIRQGTA
jgi:hypothetical protein